MPIYDFSCNDCKKEFSIIAKDPPKIEEMICSNCGSNHVIREWNAPRIIFRGNGFYITDNKNREENK